jgi:hydroxymethylpyrimidine pyrophosphatase-like HAD family hydrolase
LDAKNRLINTDTLAFRRSGRRLLLVTGRELPDLVRVFPRIDLFDRVVVENGALLFEPATKKESPPSSRTPAGARGDIAQEGLTPLSVGRSIVATWEPNEKLVLEAKRLQMESAVAQRTSSDS